MLSYLPKVTQLANNENGVWALVLLTSGSLFFSLYYSAFDKKWNSAMIKGFLQ